MNETNKENKTQATAAKPESEQQLRKRPPSTPLTPSLVTQNTYKKHRVEDLDPSKKNLKDFLKVETQTKLELEDPEEDLEQEDAYLYKNVVNKGGEKGRRSQLSYKSGFNDEIMINKENTQKDLEREKMDLEPKFASFDDQIDFELYKINQQIKLLMLESKLKYHERVLNFLQLERMFEKGH